MATKTAPPETLIELLSPEAYQLPAAPTRDRDHVRGAIAQAVAIGANVLAPPMLMDRVPDNYAVSVRVVAFDARFSDDDRKARSNGVYYLTDNGGYALHRVALDRLAAAAGIEDVPAECRVESPERFLWRATHTVRFQDFDGTIRKICRDDEYDLRELPDSWQGGKGDPMRRLFKAREKGAARCQSTAANRAIRAALGLKGAYTADEAAQPFVLFRLLYTPDLTNPAIAELVTATALGVVGELYGARAAAQARAAAPPVVEVETVGHVDDDDRGDGDREPDDDDDAPPPRREERRREPEPPPRPEATRPRTGGGYGGDAPRRRREPPPAHPDDDPDWSRDPQGSLVDDRRGGGRR